MPTIRVIVHLNAAYNHMRQEYFLRYEHAGERVVESGLCDVIREMLVIHPFQRY